MPDGFEVQELDLLSELERLEEKIQDVTRVVNALRERNRELERECERLNNERGVTVERLSRLIERVDALRGEA